MSTQKTIMDLLCNSFFEGGLEGNCVLNLNNCL